MAELVQELTGCTLLDAEEALKRYNGNVVDAVESLVVVPKIKGSQYIPKKPEIDHGISKEQQELCRKGRELQDKVNAVISVAHSQLQHEHQPQVHEEQAQHSSALVSKPA